MSKPTDTGNDERHAESTIARTYFGDVAPTLAELTDTVLMDRIWTSPSLSFRDREIATIASAIARGTWDELQVHFERALDGGFTREELAELLAHVAFYVGFPAAIAGAGVLRKVEEARG